MLSRIQIRQFLAVVNTGSFTRAAKMLNVAQPSLSGGIAELERQLGTRLFIRERRRIRLTDAGNHLLPLARSIEFSFEEVQIRIGSIPEPARPIRLGILETVPTHWLERAAERYKGFEPLEFVEGRESELHAAIISGSLDLALTLVNESEHEVLLSEDYCLAMSASHPLAHSIEVAASEVAGDRMIARRACEVLGETSRFFTQQGVRPHFAMRSANDDRAMAMVRAGLAITVAPRSFGGQEVVMLPISGFRLSRRIGLIFSGYWKQHFGSQHPLVKVLRETKPINEPVK